MSSPHMVARFFVRSDGRLILGGADPRHPSRIGYDTPLVPWSPR